MNTKLMRLAARLRKDAELLAVVHISDEESLAIANFIAPLSEKVSIGATAPKCNAPIAGHHVEYCALPRGHKGDCDG